MPFTRPLITARDLADLMSQEKVVIADCRFTIGGDREAGRRAYLAGHIPGAVYFHLDEDMAAPPAEHGGRHPLPDPAAFATRLSAAGIGPGVKVVAYDAAGAPAARFWWLLRYFGHEDVAVLDGGFKAWTAAGLPVSTEVPDPVTGITFVPKPRPEMTASMEEVRERPSDVALVDSRTAERFAGKPNPMDERSGHIPGAINRYYMDSLAPDGTLRPAKEQAARFAGLDPQRLILYCGSGVTACTNLLALEAAGLTGARLYVGSWSDWCSYPENPVER